MRKFAALGMIVGGLAGCATSSTGSVSAGTDAYTVSTQAGVFPNRHELLLAEALAEATGKCATLNRALKVTSTTENPGPFGLSSYSKATVVFSCVKAAG